MSEWRRDVGAIARAGVWGLSRIENVSFLLKKSLHSKETNFR